MMTVVDLFPIPLEIEQVSINIEETKFVSDYASDKDNFNLNQNKNYVSKDTYVLNNMPNLKTQIEALLKRYVYDILGEESTLRITQSWINYNPIGTSHHKHTHSNSIVSGVIYLQTDNDTGNFHVYRPASQSRLVHDEVTNWQKYSYDFVYFTPKINECFLFPSTLPHSVEENKSKISRISLSFNTFYLDSFGVESKMTAVTLR